MASRMANELMFRIIHKKTFNNAIVSVLESSAMTEGEFKASTYTNDYYLDQSRTYINGEQNANLIFELFGEFSAQTPETTRNCMISSIENTMEEFKTSCKMAQQLKQISGEDWVAKMKSTRTPGDELCLFVLGQLYFRHSAVINKYNVWCTVDTSMHITEKQLLEWSSLCFVYLGNSCYGLLRLKTRISQFPQMLPMSLNTGTMNPVLTNHGRRAQRSQ